MTIVELCNTRLTGSNSFFFDEVSRAQLIERCVGQMREFVVQVEHVVLLRTESEKEHGGQQYEVFQLSNEVSYL